MPSRPWQVLWQDLRAERSSAEEKGALYDSVDDKEKVTGLRSAAELILVNCGERWDPLLI